MHRRRFIQQAVAVFPAVNLAPAAQKVPERTGGPFLKLSCNLFSFNALLRSGQMKLEEVFEFCAGLGFAAVDPTAYYFPNYPAVPDNDYLYSLKRKAFLLGLDISGTGVRNDFTDPDRSKREADVALVKTWLECAVRFGAPVLRVFSGRGVPEGHSKGEVMAWVVEAIRSCAEHGKKHGVMVGLQNHADFIETPEDVLAILRGVNSEWLGLHLDIGSFKSDDPYAEIAKVARHAVTWQIKEDVSLKDRQVKTDLGKLMRIIKDAGYRGYLPLETLGEGDPRIKLPRFLDEVRKAMA